MKRENKAYSFKEQMIELELKEVSPPSLALEAAGSLCCVLSPDLSLVLSNTSYCSSVASSAPT